MKIITYDVEVFAHDWLVVFKDKNSGKYTSVWNDNEELRACISDECVYVGFNSKHYDKYIIEAIVNGCAPEEVKEVNDFIIHGGQGWECPLLQSFPYFNFNNVDLMDDMQVGLSLKSIEAHLGISIKESSVSFDLDRSLTPDERKETEKYCKHDVDSTEMLLDLRKEYLNTKINIGRLAGITDVKALSLTNAKLTALLLKAKKQEHSDERDYKYPDNLLKEYIPKEVFKFFDRLKDKSISDDEVFKSNLKFDIGDCPVTIGFGGIHGAIPTYQGVSDEKRIIRNWDVASYYPHLCTINGYTSRNIPSPQVYSDVLKERMEAKASGNKNKANALKLVCNTTYGATLNQYNDLYDPLQARSVCISGQLYLLELTMHLVNTIPNLKVVQLNTDGGMYEFDVGDYEKVKQITKEWQERTGFELEEDEIQKIIQKDVNNYLEIQEDNAVKTKGGYLVRGITMVGAFNINNDCTIVATALKEYFINGTAVEKTINDCDDIMQFQIIAKASHKYNGVYHEVNGERVPVQKCNRIYATNNSMYGKLYKTKTDGSISKIANLPEHCLIDNDNQLTISNIDKSFYIDMATKRLNDFLGTQEERKEMATANKNVYQKLIEARLEFLNSEINQSGKNINLSFKYFELKDIVPTVTKIFEKIGLIAIVTFGSHMGNIYIHDTDNPEDKIFFSVPFTPLEPIVSNNGKQVTNDMQALGSSITYMRRYLYLIAMDICVNDEIEPTITTDTNRYVPPTKEERNEVKQQLTSPDDTATDLQLKGLKNVLKQLKDKGQTELVEKIAIQTNNFKSLTKADCEKLIEKLKEKLKEVEDERD